MIKEAIEKILGLASIQTQIVGSQIFTNSDLELVKDAVTDILKVRNLSGIVDYLKNNFDSKLPVLIHVESPTRVNVLTRFNRDLHRSTLIEAHAFTPEIAFGRYYDIESFNILLQSCFVQTELRDTLLGIVGNVKDENVTNFGDDGVSQQVTAKTGVATVGPVKLPNPVWLKPFRTFVEIEQPLSAFVFRMKDGPSASLFEADGGAWKVVAVQEIKSYLSTALNLQVESGEIVIVG
ncbi:hypothetical protein ACFOQM_12580 [Paenibacillus sp. GCM10012307]|uniref:hypothetical protein n=1 Tax=Paenibacillus TaxID=44249 RepID=UPI001E4CC8B0|nr:hypothetical protein [Paenibacillus roseus]